MKMEEEIDNKIIFGKYKILKLLGKGSFGFVYQGKNIINDDKVALKVEDWRLQGDVLETEAYFLYYLKGFGIPEVKSFGVYSRYKILVQTLLGNSIEKEFHLRKDRYELKDICMIAIQLIDRLEYIHSKYIIHRDIKPENILIDEETKKIIYLIDFGLAKKYRSARSGRHVKFTIPRRLTGTARYASTNALRGTEQSRRDDLESLGYVLIYLARKGYLPWQGLPILDRLERYKRIYQLKKLTKPEKLCEDISYEFCEYLKYTKNLQFEEKPDYDYLRGLFLNILNRSHLQNDLKFSWLSIKDKVKDEKNKNMNQNNNNDLHSRNGSLSKNKRKRSPYYRILRNIQNSKEREKNFKKINQINLSIEIENKAEQRDNNLLVKRKKEKEKEKLKVPMKFNDEEKKDINKDMDISKTKITTNENHTDTHSDNLGTQITLFNLSVNMDDVNNNINYYEIKNNKNMNELYLTKNKTLKFENNHRNNTISNRPIIFNIKNGSFNNAQILRCLSQNNIKTGFINIEKMSNFNDKRISIKDPFFPKKFFEKNIISEINKMNSNNINKNSQNKINANNSANINNISSNNINNIKIRNDNSISNGNKNSNINDNNYIKFQNFMNNQIKNQKKIKLNVTNPFNSISLDNINKSLDNNRRHYISPLHNLEKKNNNIIMSNNKHLKKIFFQNKNNNANNNINISIDTKEENKSKINYYKLNNENVIYDIKNKVPNREYSSKNMFNIQKKLNEIKSNSLKNNKSPKKENSNYINLYNSKSQDHFVNQKYKLKNNLNFNNKNLINLQKYNNFYKNPFILNKNKIIPLPKKNSMVVNGNQLNRINLNQNESEFSNKKRRNYNSPINNRSNNQNIKRNIYNNNNILNNSYINPTNNNINFNIINNKIINTNTNPNIQRKFLNKNNFSPEDLNNNINITISGNRNEYKSILTFNK